MTNRMLITTCAAMVLVAAASAQAPTDESPLPPPAPTDGPVFPFATCGAGEACAGSGGSFWVTGEILLSWIQGNRLPPLVTTSPAGTDRTVAGVLRSPNTNILFDGKVNNDDRWGLRLGTGYWFDRGRTFGIEAGALILESQSTLFAASSDGTTILARPYTDAATNLPQSVLIAFPGSSSGSVDVRASSGNFYEAHLDLTENIFDKGWVRCNSLLGYRFFRFDEGLHVRQTVVPTDPNFVPGTQIDSVDDFVAQNEFHGCDLGLRTQLFWETLTLDLLGKVAVGNLHRRVKINGSQVVAVPGTAPATQTGGVLALPSNIGTFGSTDWEVFPELGVNLSWQVRSNLRLHLGYTALILDDVARAAGQLDVNINPNRFPPALNQTGPNRPAFILNRQDLTIHSVSAGLEFTF